jgi:hypothetical protein
LHIQVFVHAVKPALAADVEIFQTVIVRKFTLLLLPVKNFSPCLLIVFAQSVFTIFLLLLQP